ncbi:hypothetical protein B0T24DRAFT_693285 [Lasiosphaeria ovina]|uniref:Uncharacterized protein n=1 Tax=Lasiosphaeria ovina TaxID=92902 RepID=A0AAE0MXF5_9PEZI|nr:hypothetical protein B0T24DRAFT_693285 [Lasiosphaeria ovina]
MPNENKGWLPEDKLDPTFPPPPYAPHLESGDVSEKEKRPSTSHSVEPNDTRAQQQEEASKGSTRLWGRALRRIFPRVSRHPKNKTYTAPATTIATATAAATTTAVATANAATTQRGGHPNVSQGVPKWHGHNGMTRGSGIISTKLGLPLVPPSRFSLLEARLCFAFNDLSSLRGSVPWRANTDDYASSDERDPSDWSDWVLRLSVTSRDGDWLANLSRIEAAAFTDSDSAIRVIGWVHPERDSIKGSRVFYVKNLSQPWLETVDLNYGPPESPPDDVARDMEMRQLMDEVIERFIQGGD